MWLVSAMSDLFVCAAKCLEVDKDHFIKIVFYEGISGAVSGQDSDCHVFDQCEQRAKAVKTGTNSMGSLGRRLIQDTLPISSGYKHLFGTPTQLHFVRSYEMQDGKARLVVDHLILTFVSNLPLKRSFFTIS